MAFLKWDDMGGCAMPPPYFWETPYRCVARPIRIIMHVNAVSRERDFKFQPHQKMFVGGLCPGPNGRAHSALQTP